MNRDLYEKGVGDFIFSYALELLISTKKRRAPISGIFLRNNYIIDIEMPLTLGRNEYVRAKIATAYINRNSILLYYAK